MIKNSFCIEEPAGAKRFGEAYPLGNGRIGAMIYGGAPKEEIVLTENTFFSGCRTENNIRPGAADAFQKMRDAARSNEFKKAHELAENFIGIRNQYGTNLPVGVLSVTYTDTVLVKRQLDIRTGTASRELKFLKDGTLFQEECFISHEENALFLSMETAGKAIDLSVGFQSYSGTGNAAVNGRTIDFLTGAFETMHCDQPCGVLLQGKVICLTDGKTELKKRQEAGEHDRDKTITEELKIEGATYLRLMVLMKTGFPASVTAAGLEAMLAAGETDPCRMEEEADRLEKAGYQEIREKHRAEHTEKMDRVSIRLGQDMQSEFLYQYGRYLLLASSREDSVLPAHLQGIWNDNVACRIGWTCDMHLDINTQMNYWIAETCALQECLPPLFAWIQDSLVPEGRKTARKAYGMSGWVGEIVSNAWGYAAPYWASPIAPCPTGGVWILTHVWEHYQFSRDPRFLEERVLPLVREAVMFFQEYLFEENGVLTSGPSISPENSFQKEEDICQISNGCTYEILMIRELFQIYIRVCEELNNIAEEDAKRSGEVKEQLKKLLPYRILEDGTIAEFAHDFKVPDRQHRHTSHLLGLFPFDQIDPDKTPLLSEAAEKTISSKLTPESGWEDTGWARSMLLLYEARLRHPQKAWYHLQSMQKNLLEPNGMIFHPPTRGAGAFDHVYELDGNTGLTAGMTEMLLQSQNDKIQLLPALPSVWADGAVCGLCARGGLKADLYWRGGKLEKACLSSVTGGNYRICYNGQETNVILCSGGMKEIVF